MREHQIVISLKPEHFQQVQRMARADGSKSVSVFVRQRLLSSLGLDGQELAAESSSDPDWQHIAGQLRRLHRELQVFIAESIASNQLADEPEPPMFIVPEENFVTKGGPILVEYNPAHQLYVEQKQALGQPQQAPPTQPPSLSKSPSFDAATDELEQLADRAFAISPRLGAIESAPAATNKYDPLQDLLEEKLIRKAAGHEQTADEMEDEPEDEDDVSGQPDEREEKEETAATDEDESLLNEPDDEETGGTTSSAVVHNDEQNLDADADDDDDDDEVHSKTHINDTDDQTDDPDDMAPPPAPPPISGGPPPRKRLR
jgi:hypothetical protein